MKRSADALPYTLYRADPGTKVQHIQHSNAAPARVFSEEELRSLAATYDEALTLARDAGRIASFPRFGITFLAFAASRLNRGSGPDNSDTNAKDRLFLLPGPCYENSQLDSVLGSWLSESTHLPSVAIVDAAVSGAQINLLTNTIKALAEKGCAMPQEVLVVAIAGQNERHRAKKGRTDQMWQVGGKTVRLVWLEPLNLIMEDKDDLLGHDRKQPIWKLSRLRITRVDGGEYAFAGRTLPQKIFDLLLDFDAHCGKPIYFEPSGGTFKNITPAFFYQDAMTFQDAIARMLDTISLSAIDKLLLATDRSLEESIQFSLGSKLLAQYRSLRAGTPTAIEDLIKETGQPRATLAILIAIRTAASQVLAENSDAGPGSVEQPIVTCETGPRETDRRETQF